MFIRARAGFVSLRVVAIHHHSSRRSNACHNHDTESAKPCIRATLCDSSPSHHRAVVELSRSRIVDDVRYHSEYRLRRILSGILWYLLALPVLQVDQVRPWVRPVALHSELPVHAANQQRAIAHSQRAVDDQQCAFNDACSAAIFFAPKRDKFCTARRCQKDTFCTVQK